MNNDKVMDNDTTNQDNILDNNKDETDDDASESSDKLINSNPNQNTNQSTKPNIENISIEPLDETTKLHFRARSVLEGITPKEQKEIAADMFSQMKQLKAANDVMGYHGFSGLLQRHDSNMNITGNASPASTNNKFLTSHSQLNEIKDDINDSDSYQSDGTNLQLETAVITNEKHNIVTNIVNDRNVSSAHKNNHVTLSETKPLRQKLETISMSINKIRQDLVNQNSENNVFNNISQKQLNETIMFFQNQLTDIQDQIEDAENDIESHIDVKLLQYMEAIKLNRILIKNMKKENKEKEKLLQLNKEKEQKKIIDMQRMQIDQLIRVQSDTIKQIHIKESQNHQYSQTMSQLNFSKKDMKNNITTKMSKKRRHSSGALSTIDSSENDYNINDIQLATNNNLNIQINENAISSPYGDDIDDMHFSNASPYNNTIIHHNICHSPINNEGQYYQYKNVQKPLLSDNAIKIIGGVAIFLSGVWIVSKYIDNKGNNMGSSSVYRGPRFKY